MALATQARRLSFASFILGIAAGACGGGSPASPAYTAAPLGNSEEDASIDAPASTPFANCGSPPTRGSIPADVEAVLSARCQTCHQAPPLHGAPFPLLTYADVHSAYMASPTPKYQVMHARIQADGSPHMPFGNAPQLSADQFKTLDDWLLACAPPAG